MCHLPKPYSKRIIRRKGGHCNVVNCYCDAPPEKAEVRSLVECYACGELVCLKCSDLRFYGPANAKVRICDNCAEIQIDDSPIRALTKEYFYADCGSWRHCRKLALQKIEKDKAKL